VPLIRTVVLDHTVREALDSACEQWDGTSIAWSAIEWTVARDPEVGRLITNKANVRELIYDGAKSIKHPDIYLVYEVMERQIIIKLAVFVDAQASYAGRG
jgi:hypothetical protein